AGICANRSAAAQLGTAGFKAGPADAAKTALEAWNAYTRLEPLRVDEGELRHQYILAHAYGGKKEQAQAVILVQLVIKQMQVYPTTDVRYLSVSKLKNCYFWYDAGRICSLGGDVSSALSCFHGAVIAGFRDMEGAKVHPDLANLRAGAPQQFEKVIALGA